MKLRRGGSVMALCALMSLTGCQQAEETGEPADVTATDVSEDATVVDDASQVDVPIGDTITDTTDDAIGDTIEVKGPIGHYSFPPQITGEPLCFNHVDKKKMQTFAKVGLIAARRTGRLRGAKPSEAD